MRSFEPCIAADVPQPLAGLLRALLAVVPSSRPTAEAARIALAGLASEALSWRSGGDAPDAACLHRQGAALTERSFTLVAFDVEGVHAAAWAQHAGATAPGLQLKM